MNGSGWQNLILQAKHESNFSTSTTVCCILLPYFLYSWRNIRYWDDHLRSTSKAINSNNCTISIKRWFLCYSGQIRMIKQVKILNSCSDRNIYFLNYHYLYFNKLLREVIVSHSLEMSKTRLDSFLYNPLWRTCFSRLTRWSLEVPCDPWKSLILWLK